MCVWVQMVHSVARRRSDIMHDVVLGHGVIYTFLGSRRIKSWDLMHKPRRGTRNTR